MIHQLWLDRYHRHRIDMAHRHQYMALSETSYQNVVICQPQHLNRSGKIFGGYLMKIAYELARVTAYRFIGGLSDIYDASVDRQEIIEQHPQFVSSDEITFEHPVSVGCIIRNESVVSCTDTMNVMEEREQMQGEFYEGRRAMMIFVRTHIQEPGKSEEILSNVFSFCFVVPKPKRVMRRVIPLTYEESMVYITGKRALDQTTRIAIRDGSVFAQYL